MTKVSEKVGNDLAKNEVFRRKLNTLVWSEEMSIVDFEEQWRLLMKEYKLVDHRWFIALYEIRSFWIPAFFADMFMGGLMRTTSRSEGENSAFGKFMYPHSSLLEFYTNFEGVIDAQRHNQSKRDAACEGYLPELKTPLELEHHAATTYTTTIFYEVQKEIIGGCFNCRVIAIREEGELTLYDIKGDSGRIFRVQHNPVGNTVVCSCGLFQRLGLPCMHMFLVFKDVQVVSIPAQYIVPRWTQHPTTLPLIDSSPSLYDQNSGVLSAKSHRQELWRAIFGCVGLVGNSTYRMTRMGQVLQEMKAELLSDSNGQEQVMGNKHAIEALCGVVAPLEISIKPPVVAKNKGTGKRIKGKREIAIAESLKGKRKCGTCKQFARHNSRTCPMA